jgi:hypothetical protein
MKLYPEEDNFDTASTVTTAEPFETAAAGNLPNAASITSHAEATRVESGAGSDICATDLQSEIERTYGPSDWHVPVRSETVGSAMPVSSQDQNW